MLRIIHLIIPITVALIFKAKCEDEVQDNLRKTIASVKKSCGEVCDLNKKGKPGKYFDVIEKNFDCLGLFSNPDFDKPLEFSRPPKYLPFWLKDDFAYHGQVEIKYGSYFDDMTRRTGTYKYDFSKNYIDAKNKRLDKGDYSGIVFFILVVTGNWSVFV